MHLYIAARLDVVARDFRGRNRQRAFSILFYYSFTVSSTEAFFDIKVFNPFARSYFRTPLSKCYHLHEREKRRAYDERVREVERACFSGGGKGSPSSPGKKRCSFTDS